MTELDKQIAKLSTSITRAERDGTRRETIERAREELAKLKDRKYREQNKG